MNKSNSLATTFAVVYVVYTAQGARKADAHVSHTYWSPIMP